MTPSSTPAVGGARAVVVVARFNEGVTRRLLDGAIDHLCTGPFTRETIEVVWVPGAFEIPVVLASALRTGAYRIGVALGAVIRGETPHFEYIAAETARRLGALAVETGVPVGFGLLTCDTLDQARERAGGAAGNKGAEAAAAAMEAAEAIDRFHVT